MEEIWEEVEVLRNTKLRQKVRSLMKRLSKEGSDSACGRIARLRIALEGSGEPDEIAREEFLARAEFLLDVLHSA